MPSPLISFSLPAHPARVLQSTFLNESFFHDFLTIKLHNKDIHQSPWTPLPTQTFEQYAKDISPKSSIPESFHWIFPDKKETITRQTRDVSSSHPVSSSQSYLKLLLGFLPSYSESVKYQTLLTPFGDQDVAHATSYEDDTKPQYFILEKASFRGLPFADIFEINTLWRFQGISTTRKNDKNESSTSAKGDSNKDKISNSQTNVSIFIHFDFKKSCWIKEVIKTGTKSELKEVLRLWCEYATDTLQRLSPPNHFRSAITPDNLDEKLTDSKLSGKPKDIGIKVTVKKKFGGKHGIRSWLNKLPWRRQELSEIEK